MYNHEEEEEKKLIRRRKRRPSQPEGCMVQKLKDFRPAPENRHHRGVEPEAHAQKTSTNVPIANEVYEGRATRSQPTLPAVHLNQIHAPVAALVGPPQEPNYQQVSRSDINAAGSGAPYLPQSPVEGQLEWYGGGQQPFVESLPFTHWQDPSDDSAFLTGPDEDAPLRPPVNISISPVTGVRSANMLLSPISPSGTSESASPSYGFHFANYNRHFSNYHQLPQLTRELQECGCSVVYGEGGILGIIPASAFQGSTSTYPSPQSSESLNSSLDAVSLFSPRRPVHAASQFLWPNAAGPSRQPM